MLAPGKPTVFLSGEDRLTCSQLSWVVYSSLCMTEASRAYPVLLAMCIQLGKYHEALFVDFCLFTFSVSSINSIRNLNI